MGCGASTAAANLHDYSLPAEKPRPEAPPHAADADDGSDVADEVAGLTKPAASSGAARPRVEQLHVGPAPGTDGEGPAESPSFAAGKGAPASPVATLDLRATGLLPRPGSAPARGLVKREGLGSAASPAPAAAPSAEELRPKVARLSVAGPASLAPGAPTREWHESALDSSSEEESELPSEAPSEADSVERQAHEEQRREIEARNARRRDRVRLVAPPPVLKITSEKSSRTTGIYTLTSEEHCGFPVWEKVEGRDRRWVFSTRDGHWGVSNTREDFTAEKAGAVLFNSKEPHRGKMPGTMRASGWRMFDYADDPDEKGPVLTVEDDSSGRDTAVLERQEEAGRRILIGARDAAYDYVSGVAADTRAFWRLRNALFISERQGRAGVREEEAAARRDVMVLDRAPRPRPGSAPSARPRLQTEDEGPKIERAQDNVRARHEEARLRVLTGEVLQPGELAHLVMGLYDAAGTGYLSRREWNTLLKHLGLPGNSAQVFSEACRSHGGDPHRGVGIPHLSALLGGKPAMARKICEMLFPEEKTTFIGWSCSAFGKLPLCACSKEMSLSELSGAWQCRLCGRPGLGLRWRCPDGCHGADFCLQCNSLEWVAGGDRERMDAIGGWLLRRKKVKRRPDRVAPGAVASARDRMLDTLSVSSSRGNTLTAEQQRQLSTYNDLERMMPSAHADMPSQAQSRSLRSASSGGLDPVKFPLSAMLHTDPEDGKSEPSVLPLPSRY
eukprot:TRINITY_DN1712_c0_g1_i1.p1 TRINITY_DN1712_c0_g1~~TRINITY_DN1712_c0_g1_i1.p1  ORF type:complete len:730 (+),score=126.46 TRINITY_DN1712_c0_g1_i1:79-2268(+)